MTDSASRRFSTLNLTNTGVLNRQLECTKCDSPIQPTVRVRAPLCPSKQQRIVALRMTRSTCKCWTMGNSEQPWCTLRGGTPIQALTLRYYNQIRSGENRHILDPILKRPANYEVAWCAMDKGDVSVIAASRYCDHPTTMSVSSQGLRGMSALLPKASVCVAA
jgi:hypothetical protein